METDTSDARVELTCTVDGADVGVSAAIANAVHHATGRRVRRLPIRLEDVL